MKPVLLVAAVFSLLVPGCSSGTESECTADADCPAGFFCRQDQCDYDCTHDPDCPEGFYCDNRGRCQRGCVKTNGGVEACDGEDNDCDGATDENFPDVGAPCDNRGCPGTWACSTDGSSQVCDAPEPAADDSVCDGLDEDCDGATDEDAVTRPCPLQQGVCAGTSESCLGGSWTGCDYGPSYTEGIDSGCDFIDSDCDGATDEDAAPILEPESGDEASDGLDNNCNGLVDEPGGVMVTLPLNPNIYIDSFEIVVTDDPGCQGTHYGIASDDYPAGWPVEGAATTTLYACSLPGTIPSGHLSWYRANRACEAQGKYLCRRSDWRIACNGGMSRLYPYGHAFVSGACNDPFDDLEGVAPSGSLEECTALGRVFDASGNLAEWLQEWDTNPSANGLAAGGQDACEWCNAWGSCQSCTTQPETTIHEMLECVDDRSYPRNLALSFLGARCCMDAP